MNEDIKLHVKNCTVCNKTKALNRKPRAALHNDFVGHPMDRVALDVIGPLPKSRKNNKFSLGIGDHLTRWMEAYPLPHQKAEQVAEKLIFEFMSRFGTPLEIQTDQGRNFEGEIFTHVCKLFEGNTVEDEDYFIMASVPYNVTWGFSQDTDLKIHTESGEIVEEIDIVELTGQSEEMTIAEEMVEKQTETECNDLQTIQNLKTELENLKF
ncbi:unnamed protein product [Mytilus coruscus]|uniref:Integrase catalytic domain-containing protein n=1 Tax=Mytilus coruscus TaxID=42192 RepID=A0A6J8EM12_MYTCO|nr:unnamed protein product [Mytilus coruscus]